MDQSRRQIEAILDGPDPNRLVEQWFASRYPLVTELYPPGITLKGYAPGYQTDTLPDGQPNAVAATDIRHLYINPIAFMDMEVPSNGNR